MRLTILALAAVLAVGCGGDDDADTPPVETTTEAADTSIDGAPMAGEDAVGEGAVGEGTVDEDRAGAGGDVAAGREGTEARDEGAAGAAGASSDQGRAADGPASGQRLYTVQVASFTEASSADEWEDRLRSQGLPVWTSLAEVGGRTFHRLRVGAVSTVDEARRLGAMITQRYEWPVWVAPITAADGPPENALEATRTMMGD